MTNEYYAKDISKKRRIVNKMKGNAGVPLSPPPYGYIKNPDDPRFWVVEPEAAEVVRRIYRIALEGYGLAEIAARLAADGVVNPTYYWRSRGTSRSGSKSTVEPTKWGHTTVKNILTLQEYCGDVINFKSYSKSYKMKKRIENPEENRAIFLNVHEAIIDRQTWEKVQALQKGTRRKKPTVTQEPSVFSGLLKCPECGGNLNFHFNQNNHDIKFFSCQNHNSGYRKCSKTHYIRLDFLEQVVLYEVKRLACFASEYENDFIKAMIGRSAKVAENTALRKQRELDALTARDRELDMLFERLYEDNVAGKIDDARFAKMSKRYEQEQGENAKKIKALRLELKKTLSEYEGVSVMVTHDRDEAFQLCDHLLLMEEGRVIAAGETKVVFADPGTWQAARLTGCKNLSRIEKTGSRKVRALDWNGLELVTAQDVGDEIEAVGIRAHDFEPLSSVEALEWKKREDANLIPVEDAEISEMPFEWYVTMKNHLWWKLEKTIHVHESAGLVPEYLRISPEAIVLLRTDH